MKKQMDAIILVGGLGTRLRKTVPDVPKPLAPINNTPFLQILMQHMEKYSCFGKVIFALSYRSEQIISFVEGCPFRFSVAFSIESSPLGTGGAVKKAMQLTTTEHVFVLNGDTYLDIAYHDFLQNHLHNEAEITIAYRKSDCAKRYGSLKIDPYSQRILSFSEKTEGEGWINGGVYLFDRNLFNVFSNDPFSLENNAFPSFLKKRIYGYHCSSLFIDIGTEQSFHQAQQLLKPLEEMKT